MTMMMVMMMIWLDGENGSLDYWAVTCQITGG
jgi:hypothetical protein